MIRITTRLLLFSAIAGFVLVDAISQQRPAVPAVGDPRVGLKPGFLDAGTAARNIQLVKSLPKADGFFDPKTPAGTPVPPEPQPAATAAPGSGTANAAAPPEDQTAEAPNAQQPAGLNFANSDLAFARDHLFMGNFHGFNTYSVE